MFEAQKDTVHAIVAIELVSVTLRMRRTLALNSALLSDALQNAVTDKTEL